MNVIGHQAIAEQIGPIPLHGLMEQIEVDAPLAILLQDEALRCRVA